MSSIPIIVCGKNPKIAKKVRADLLPEYDVTHIMLSLESAISDIPLLLSSKIPPNTSDNHGSQDYAKPPVAVALGGGFDDEMFEQIREACKDAPSTVWLRTDTSKKERPPRPDEAEAYGKAVGERVKKCLGELRVGEEGGRAEGVVFF